MLLLFPSDTHSPYRHMIPPVVFGGMAAVMLWFRFRKRSAANGGRPAVLRFREHVRVCSFRATSTPPQLNLAPFAVFVLLPVANSYAEFLTFDLLNSLIIILGFSEVLQPLGINYNFHTERRDLRRVGIA